MRQRMLVVTREDMDRLTHLLDSTRQFHDDRPYLAALREELEGAKIVPASQVPANVVTMHSTVRIIDVGRGERITYMLVYPREADFKRQRLSVLAPIGTALLGYREGDVVEWETPAGKRKLKIEQVIQQPEAAKRAAA